MDKELIYNAIAEFFNSKETKNDSRKIGEKYFYVNTKKSNEGASFIGYLIKEKKINLSLNLNIMDLCFGSANLASHIILDNNLNFNKIYFNDIDTDVSNQKIKINEKSQVLNFDFLNFKQFKDFKNNIDILIFNPTISDGDIHRKISIKENDQVVEDNSYLDIKVAFIKYCEELSLKIINDIKIDRENKTITVQIEGTKKLLDKLPNSFNNYSLICKTKSMQDYKNRASTVTKINQTISETLKDNGLIVFMGTDKQREVIFQNYNTVFKYLRDDNDIFVIQKSENTLLECFEKNGNDFVECTSDVTKDEKVESFDDIEIDNYENYAANKEIELMKKEEKKDVTETFINDTIGNLKFLHKNLLLKGVPGTGKSQTLEDIIERELDIKGEATNICRINIHSASSNADLMQGIGISTNGTNVEYKEKQGLIYNHIKKALFSPNQPFVLVLEEIQENSLNELIGDLIYLIEDKKRIKVDVSKFEDKKEYDYQAFIEQVLQDEKNEHYIEIPYLVDTSTEYRKMVLPANLYVFCTSNYRDDKKVIEDNLLRRFDVVEIYPQTQDTLGAEIFKSKEVSDFLSKLNELIEKQFEEETHPDRYLVGHANWLDITEEDNDKNKKSFYTALLKVIIEFKEIREVDFDSYTKEILEKLLKDEALSERIQAYIKACEFEYKSYKEMVEKLQRKIYTFIK